MAERGIRPVGSGLQSAQDESLIAEIVSLSGNEAEDAASVQAKEEEIQGIFETQSGVTNEPSDESDFEAAQTGPCQRGDIGDLRRRTMHYRSSFGGTSVRVRVSYERTSCRQWRIYHVDTTLVAGNREVRVDSHSYPWARAPGAEIHPFGSITYYWGCRKLLVGRRVSMDASGDWTFYPGYYFGHASSIKSDNPGQNDPDCRFNLGVHISGSVKLTGPKK